MKEKITEGAESLFIRYGIRSISMDDVARELSISKKTIYQHFKNKDELVSEATRYHLDLERAQIDATIVGAKDAMEELFLLSKCMRENISRLNPSLIYDLQKYHSDAWEFFKNFKDHFMKGKVRDNIKRGKKEGFFRPEVDEEILSIMRVEQVQMIFNERIFPKTDYDFVNTQMQVYDHFIHGLLSEKGYKKYHHYNQLIKNHNTK